MNSNKHKILAAGEFKLTEADYLALASRVNKEEVADLLQLKKGYKLGVFPCFEMPLKFFQIIGIFWPPP